jgi:hypothetical protein
LAGFVREVGRKDQFRERFETPEVQTSEEIYSLFDGVNFFMDITLSKRAVVGGCAALSSSVMLFGLGILHTIDSWFASWRTPITG